MNEVKESAEPLLPLFERATAEDGNVKWLEDYLKAAGEWLTAGALEEIAGRSEWGGRWVRNLAQSSDWVISGQKGYKHLEQATAEEVNHFVGWMESQGKKMVARAERVRRNAHRQLRG